MAVAHKLSGLARALSEGNPTVSDDYRPRSILLTGGAGFIASHVAIRLVEQYPDCKVCAATLHGPNISCPPSGHQ